MTNNLSRVVEPDIQVPIEARVILEISVLMVNKGEDTRVLLAPKDPQLHKKTLVLDMDETLMHTDDQVMNGTQEDY